MNKVTWKQSSQTRRWITLWHRTETVATTNTPSLYYTQVKIDSHNPRVDSGVTFNLNPISVVTSRLLTVGLWALEIIPFYVQWFLHTNINRSIIVFIVTQSRAFLGFSQFLFLVAPVFLSTKFCCLRPSANIDYYPEYTCNPCPDEALKVKKRCILESKAPIFENWVF